MNHLEKQYLEQGLEPGRKDIPDRGVTAWEGPSNIALVKYWGKYPGQLPMNPSLSFTLKNSVVRVRMGFEKAGRTEAGLQAFLLNGAPHAGFRKRVAAYLDEVTPFFPFLSAMALSVHSESSFPHSAGIASSAAAFSALALCLCAIERDLVAGSGGWQQDDDFVRKASFMARLGSGSASRSVEGGLVVWGRCEAFPGSSDLYAKGLPEEAVDPRFMTLRDAVLVVDDSAKKVSSSAGHALMDGHAYRQGRFAQATANMERMARALTSGDEGLFFRVTEQEALSLHSLMMSSDPGYLLMKPATLEVLDRITTFRERTGLGLGFTMDAGPNVHLVYFQRDAVAVKAFVEESLVPLCAGGRWIDDALGRGGRPFNSGSHG